GSSWLGLPTRFETLTHGSGTFTITQSDGSKLIFDDTAPGLLKRLEDVNGQALTFAWTSTSGAATDASGRTTSLAIDAGNGRITSVTDSATRSWSFAYSGSGATSKLVSVTDPTGVVATVAYDLTTGVANSLTIARAIGVPSSQNV